MVLRNTANLSTSFSGVDCYFSSGRLSSVFFFCLVYGLVLDLTSLLGLIIVNLPFVRVSLGTVSTSIVDL